MFHYPAMGRTLESEITVAFDYTRSTGPVVGAFLSGLAEHRIVAGRLADGRVVCPPPEFDPSSYEPVEEFVEVGPGGTLQSWTWVTEPTAGQPFDRPFGYGLIVLDGCSSPLLHVIDVDSPARLQVGLRVRPRWVAEPVGSITDLVFVPGDGSEEPLRQGDSPTAASPPPITQIVTPVHLDYTYAASPEESAFFRGLAEGRLLGQRCPVCGKVYVPPRGACPVDGVPTTDEVELVHTGTVTTFCIVNVPFLGQRIKPPYVSAYVLLDGADIPFLHLILDVPAEEVRMGMRVQAVWKPREEWGTTVENISHFAPTGEPDANYETYRQHL